MPGWLGERLGVPVLVDNDVNIMALGEHWAVYPEVDHLIFVKVGTGIGCGVMPDADCIGAPRARQGDIGHIQVASPSTRLPLRLRRLPGGRGQRRRLSRPPSRPGLMADRQPGRRPPGTQAATPGHPLVRQGAERSASVLASIVNFFNPS